MKELKKIAKRYYFKHILICVLVQMMLFYAPFPNLLANPNPAPGTLPAGPTTPYGGVGSFDYSSGRLDIQNVANRAVINWQKFDIGAGATTQFHQAGSSAYVLNRVNACDGKATGINGNLIANGGVIVINPRGIVMGPSALINAGKFIASGLGISDKDFRDFATGAISVLKFDTDCLSGNVTNNGTINASEAVYLAGKNVTNTGTISCPGGMVVMAAGEKVYLAQAGSDIVVEKLDTGSNAGDHKVTSGGIINATGAGILLAAGDIYSQAVITDARSFVAQANRNLNVNGALDVTGDVTLFADFDHVLPGDFHSTAPIKAGGNIEVRGNDILFDETVDAGGNLTIKGRDCYEEPEYPWGNVHARKTLDADGDITISVTGEKQEQRWVSEGRCGGGHWEYYTTPQPGTIWLDDDVTAGGNLSIYNNTYTGAGVTLRALNNIILGNDELETTPPGFCDWLTGDTWLALRAGIEIVAPRTVISVIGSTLIMEQGLSLNLDNYLFANQTNTNLMLISNHGSITAVDASNSGNNENAADQWASIGATAFEDITLQGHDLDRNITARALTSNATAPFTGNISVTSDNRKVLATEDVKANNGSITLTAINPTNGGIEAGADILASDGITLDGVVTAVGVSTQTFEAGAGTLWAKNTVTKTGPGDLHLAGDAGVDLDGTVDVEAGSLEIENDFTAAGDLLASDNITTKNGILDGTADQRIDAKGGKLHANGTLTKTGAGNLNLGGQTGIDLDGTVDVMAGSLVIEDDFQAAGDLLASDNVTLNGAGTLDGISDQSITAQNGMVLANGTIAKINEGRMSILAADGIKLTDAAGAQDSMLLDADTDEDGLGDMLAQDSLNATAGSLEVHGKNIQVAGTSNAGEDMKMIAADNITLGRAATAVGNMYLKADEDGDGVGSMLAQSTLTTTTGDITISASDTASDNTIKLQDNVSAGQDLILNNNTEVAAGKELKAGQDVSLAGGKTMTGFGDLTVNAGRYIGLGGDVEAAGKLTVSANPASSSSNVCAYGKLTSGGDMLVEAGENVYLAAVPDSAYAGNNMTLTAGKDVAVQGNLTAGQDITISSSDNTTYIGGDVYAGRDILLNNNTKVNGLNGDQTLEAVNKLTASGYVRKVTPGDMYLKGNSDGLSIDLQYNNEGPGTSTSQGNLWILGQGDIQISGDVTTFGPSEYISIQSEIAVVRSTGGVAIISNKGKIYTHTEGGIDDTLNISVTGSSNHKSTDYRERGVYGFGLHTDGGDGGEPTLLSETEGDKAVAAIAIVSAEPLKITGSMEARGQYYSDGSVDDRPAIGFLDVDAEIPAGVPRNPGVAFDLAIYTASKNGSVEIDCPVMIMSEGIPSPLPTFADIERQYIPGGAMVADAYDKVTLGSIFRDALKDGLVGDRLEVCSRITEWLEDAAGRLPFLNSSDLPPVYSYVMRGAGLENPGITDGRAWVLESKEKPIPPIEPIPPIPPIEPFTAAAPIQQPELKFAGCPAVMNWVAKELGVEKDQIQIYVAGAMAMSSSVQPCDSCARLKNTALVLMDADGAQVKALGEVVNEFTAAGAPPSEEQMAMIAASLKNPEDGTRYALAAQWLNALAEYINILHSDLNLPIDETMAFAAKYTSPVTGGDNAALAAYVQARMDTLGG